MSKYTEIIELYEYCKKIGVHAKMYPLYDGFCIRFENGGDFVQHHGSYGSGCGCVEPAIGCRLDYKAVPLENAKSLVKRHKARLNCEKGEVKWSKQGKCPVTPEQFEAIYDDDTDEKGGESDA